MIALLIKYWKPIGLALLLLAISIWSAFAINDYGARRYAAGGDAVRAADAIAATTARAESDRKVSAAAATATQFHAELDVALPQLEVITHADVAQIHTIYLTVPGAAAICQRPAGVQSALDAARDRANAAARGELRPDPTGGTGARSTSRNDGASAHAGGHGYLGTADAGALHSRGHDPPQ
jgi:hypothetical protein